MMHYQNRMNKQKQIQCLCSQASNSKRDNVKCPLTFQNTTNYSKMADVCVVNRCRARCDMRAPLKLQFILKLLPRKKLII